MATYSFNATLWLWPGDGASWHFISLPKKESEIIKSKIKLRRGFGAVRVEARVGETTWQTSIFPDRRSGSYFLPVKAKVRRDEGLEAGDTVSITLQTI